MGKMRWRYLKKYYGRLNLRRELLYTFRYICRQLGLTQQECFLMLLLLFAEVGRWLSPDDIRRVASSVYTRLLGMRTGSRPSSSDLDTRGVRLRLDSVEVADEEEIEYTIGTTKKDVNKRRTSPLDEEEQVPRNRIPISNEVVEDWLERLRLILTKLLKEYYMLYKESERLKKKSKELKAALDEIMDYILSYDPELYIKIINMVKKKRGLDLTTTTKTRKISV